MDRGVELFRRGRYRQAADAFLLAGESNQGDAVCRIYAGHALFALGRYRQAVQHIRRAMELQPRIVYLSYDMRGDYDDVSRFDAQLAALKRALDMSPANNDRLFLLGYVLYYGNKRTASYPIFEQAHKLERDDPLITKLMQNAQPPDVQLDAMKKSPSP